MAYCEPLNEALTSITQDTIRGLTAAGSNLNHPMLEAPYFQEYSGLLNDDGMGVRGYRSEFGLQTYFDSPDLPRRGLACYLGRLLDRAEQHGKRPVLKFTRALGRACWLRWNFPAAKQILLLRHPLSQFRSGWELAERHANNTFLMIPLFTLSRPRVGAIRRLCDKLTVPYIPSSGGLAACIGAYVALARALPARTLFGAFLGMFVAAHARSAPFADLIVDQHTLESDVRYRREMEGRLRDLSGLPVDLSDCRSSLYDGAPVLSGGEMADAADLVCSTLEGEYATSVDLVRRLLSPSNA